MRATLFQDWTTIRIGGGATTVIQSKDDWLDVGPFADAIFWIEIAQTSAPPLVTLSFESAPVAQENLFVAIDSVPIAGATTAPILRKVFMNAAGGVPLARFLRWRIDGGNADLTFRVHVSLGEGVRDAFSPLNLPGLVLWLRADLGVVVSGGAVTDWKDQSGNGNHVTQTVGGSRPSVNALSNGRPALSFSGSRFLESATTIVSAAGSSYSVLAVAQNGNGALLTIRRGNVYSASKFHLANTYIFGDGVNASANMTVTNTLGETQSTSNPFKSCHQYHGAGAWPDIWLNTSHRGIMSGAPPATAQSMETGTAGFHVGTDAAGEFWNGLISEVVVTTNAIGTTDRLRVEQYQKDFWGF